MSLKITALGYFNILWYHTCINSENNSVLDATELGSDVKFTTLHEVQSMTENNFLSFSLTLFFFFKHARRA